MNPDFFEIFPSIEKVLRQNSKDVITFSIKMTTYRPNLIMEWVKKRNLEGCIFLPGIHGEHPILKEAQQVGVPCVNFGGVVNKKSSYLASDSKEGGRIVADFLVKNGHNKIGFINGPEHLRISNERYEGFREIIKKSGYDHDHQLIIHGDFSGGSGRRAALQLLEKEPNLTAIACASDLMAMGAISSIVQYGMKVPEDISVTGFYGLYFTSYMNPPLTTVDHSSEQIGTKAAEMILDLLNDQDGYMHIIHPILIERNSVAIRSGTT